MTRLEAAVEAYLKCQPVGSICEFAAMQAAIDAADAWRGDTKPSPCANAAVNNDRALLFSLTNLALLTSDTVNAQLGRNRSDGAWRVANRRDAAFPLEPKPEAWRATHNGQFNSDLQDMSHAIGVALEKAFEERERT